MYFPPGSCCVHRLIDCLQILTVKAQEKNGLYSIVDVITLQSVHMIRNIPGSQINKLKLLLQFKVPFKNSLTISTFTSHRYAGVEQ